MSTDKLANNFDEVSELTPRREPLFSFKVNLLPKKKRLLSSGSSSSSASGSSPTKPTKSSSKTSTSGAKKTRLYCVSSSSDEEQVIDLATTSAKFSDDDEKEVDQKMVLRKRKTTAACRSLFCNDDDNGDDGDDDEDETLEKDKKNIEVESDDDNSSTIYADTASNLMKEIQSMIPVRAHAPVRKIAPLKIASWDKLKQVNTEYFIKCVYRCHKLRAGSSTPGFDSLCLPCPDDLSRHFREVVMEETIETQRIGKLSPSTVGRAASSAVFFFVFIKSQKSKIFGDCFGKEQSAAKLVQDLLLSMSVVSKTQLICDFISWYETIPPLRATQSKLLASNQNMCRTMVKENTTLQTVARALLSYFTLLGVVQPSSCKAPTLESRTIWTSIKDTLGLLEKRKAGKLDLSQYGLSLHELVELMEKTDGVSNLFEFQSWLLALVLAGTGIRVGSLRNVHGGEDDDLNDLNEIGGETLEFRFNHLRSSSLRIFRVRRCAEDPSSTVRLRAELLVTSSKTSGFHPFAPKTIAFSYPTAKGDGTLNWGMNVAVALALLAVLIRNTTADRVSSDDYEPKNDDTELLISDFTNPRQCLVPLFRASTTQHKLKGTAMRCVSDSLSCVANSIRVPSTLFTSRSYRIGFAKSVVQGIVSRMQPDSVLTLSSMRETILTSARWSSRQVDRYMSSVTSNLQVFSQSDVGMTARDWLLAIASTSAIKNNYNHVTSKTLVEYLKSVQADNDKIENAKRMSAKNKSCYADALNVSNWQKASRVPSSCKTSPSQPLDIFSTFEKAENFCRSLDHPFSGLGRLGGDGTYICPDVDCDAPICDSHLDALEHWAKFHEKTKTKKTYACALCDRGGFMAYRYYMRHLNTHHSPSVNFHWVLSEAADGTADKDDDHVRVY